jgi:hypothetical protein
VDVQSAARRWAETWERAWPAKQSAEIAALYHEAASYRSSPFREAEAGGASPVARRDGLSKPAFHRLLGGELALDVRQGKADPRGDWAVTNNHRRYVDFTSAAGSGPARRALDEGEN